MRYWSNPQNHAMSSRPATLNMVVEFLSEHGYRVLKWPSSSLSVMRVGTSSRCSLEDKGLSYLCVLDANTLDPAMQDISLSSYLLVVDNSQVDAWKSLLPSALAGKTAVVLADTVDVLSVVEKVTNFLTSVQELCATLALAVSSPSLCQALINIGEDFFGCYMHVTDANHLLIGYAHHVKPLDEISKSLIRCKYHRKELLEREGIVLVNDSLSRDGIKVFPPSDLFPMGLVTKSLRVHGQFAAYIVFQMDQEKMTPGTFDAIDLFTFYLTKTLERRMGLENRRSSTSQNFLFHLVVDEGLSRAFVRDQCEMIDFPSDGSFVLMEAEWDESYEICIPSYAEELGCSAEPRLTLVDSGRVLVLFQGENDEDVIAAVQTALAQHPLKEASVIRLSDIFHALVSTYYARRTLRVIEQYQQNIDGLRCIEGKANAASLANHTRVYSFRDVFCLYWNSPAANDFLKRYSLQHMLVARIEYDDNEKGTDNLDVLTDYLINERRISVVAQNTHMHRNGVLYRIKRIQAMYHIDFDDYLSRQYVLTGLQIRESLGKGKQSFTEQFPEIEPPVAVNPVRPDIPRDVDYDPQSYIL